MDKMNPASVVARIMIALQERKIPIADIKRLGPSIIEGVSGCKGDPRQAIEFIADQIARKIKHDQ